MLTLLTFDIILPIRVFRILPLNVVMVLNISKKYNNAM